MNELLFLWLSLGVILFTGLFGWISYIFKERLPSQLGGLLFISWGLLTVALILRWIRLDHGPFTNMFEILASNIWSLILCYLLVFWKMPRLRVTSLIFLPLIYIMYAWLLMVPRTDFPMPSTYNTAWLYVHIGFGKIFMGALVVSAILSLIIIVRQWLDKWLPELPGEYSLQELSYRFLILALLFDSLMLIGGAIWAQQAWGRYWFWDSLETWSFISWLSLAVAVHLKITLKPEPSYYALFIIFVFIISFLTFFGIPFLNQIPHKGAI